MFFIVSKLFWFVFAPINFLVLLSCLGVCLWRFGFIRLGRWCAGIGLTLLFAICFLPVGQAIMQPLENRFPPPADSMPPPDGIIVLGGALDQAKSLARHQPILIQGAARLTAGIELARRYPEAKLIFTGGAASLTDLTYSEANGVETFWRSLGVPEARMTFERRSRNTWENATFTRDLVKPKPSEHWLLVTSAWHMPRSMGIFRQVGFDVKAYPVDYMTVGDDRDWRISTNALDQLTVTSFAIHEWIGLVAYRLTAKTNALFPAPGDKPVQATVSQAGE